MAISILFAYYLSFALNAKIPNGLGYRLGAAEVDLFFLD